MNDLRGISKALSVVNIMLISYILFKYFNLLFVDVLSIEFVCVWFCLTYWPFVICLLHSLNSKPPSASKER